MIRNFADFCSELLNAGFSMGGGKDKGIFAVVPFDWTIQEQVDSPVRWHTGDPETDPWEWRMRVLEERNDIAYSKLFFRASGYITKEWYPYFLAVRRQDESLESAYDVGKITVLEKQIYNVIRENERVPMHVIKQLCGINKESNADFEKAITGLQMKMYVTMCGRTSKRNKYGEEYGWSSTVFCTVEEFWQTETFPEMSAENAYSAIRQQILILNPFAKENTIKKFIYG